HQAIQDPLENDEPGGLYVPRSSPTRAEATRTRPAFPPRTTEAPWPTLRILVRMPSILVTNDDGVSSPGIRALAEALGAIGLVTIVAPLAEASAIGHALTIRRPLRLEPVGDRIYAVDGTPTDCVN